MAYKRSSKRLSALIFVLGIRKVPAKRLVSRFLLMLLGECFDRAGFYYCYSVSALIEQVSITASR